MKRNAFTLIELLVVIAIIAVLSVVVVLSLNPAELLRQSRDANRLSDLSTLNSALALYTTDQAGIAGFSLGNASSVYVSLPDSSSTCGTWNLPTLPAGYTYACVASTSTKNINSSGWIPVNFSNISGGAPFSILPIDNVNQSSAGLYYTYSTNGSQFAITAIPESQKQKTALGAKPMIPGYPAAFVNGSNFTISPLFNAAGLVRYWNFDEGMGTAVNDSSGVGDNATWASANWISGRVGSSAATVLNTGNVVFSSTASLPTSSMTIAFWVQVPQLSNYVDYFGESGWGSNGAWLTYSDQFGNIDFSVWSTSEKNSHCSSYTAAAWHFFVGTYDGTTLKSFLDGASCSNGVTSQALTTSSGIRTVSVNGQTYSIDDARIYNRALSAAEIQALYNAEK